MRGRERNASVTTLAPSSLSNLAKKSMMALGLNAIRISQAACSNDSDTYQIQSSNTSNAVCPPPEVTFSSGPADKRINAPSTLFSKRNGFKSTYI